MHQEGVDGPIAGQAIQNQLFRFAIPPLTDQPVVTQRFGAPVACAQQRILVARRGMIVVVITIHHAEEFLFVRPPDFEAREVRQDPQQFRLFFVVTDTVFQKVKSFDHVVVAISIVVEFHRDVESHVMSLKFPDFDKVWLQVGDLLQRGSKIREVLALLVGNRVRPQLGGGGPVQSEGGQFHAGAGRINLAQVGLGQPRVATKPRQQAPLGTGGGGLAEQKEGEQEEGNGRKIDDLADEETLGIHCAISRVLSMK